MALRKSFRAGTVINILGGVIGILIMLSIAYLGYYELLTPLKLLIYQFLWLVAGWLATEIARAV